MKREKMIIPMTKKKASSNSGTREYDYPGELRTTQFALEQAVKDIGALKKQFDGLAKLDKQKDFAINLLKNQMKRLDLRVTGRDAE